MNNTTFPFKKKQIVQSVLEPDTHSIWLNHKDNKLYQYNDGWEPIGGNNIYRIFLMDGGKPEFLVLDPNYEKENTLARIAFNEDYNKYTNNVYLITYKGANYGEITGVANCQNQESLIADFTTGINLSSSPIRINKTIIAIDSELFRDINMPNDRVLFRKLQVFIGATLIR